MEHTLDAEQIVPCPIEKVFAFFADAANLERITPATLRFKILSPLPIEMRSGAIIDYKLSLFGIPFRWKTLIESYEPLHQFTDVQISGPYRMWRHAHEFEPVPGGTAIRDHLRYEIPLGPLGEVARVVFVGAQVRGIFAHRRKIIEEIFGAVQA